MLRIMLKDKKFPDEDPTVFRRLIPERERKAKAVGPKKFRDIKLYQKIFSLK